MYVYIYIYMYIHIHVYIYIEREREGNDFPCWVQPFAFEADSVWDSLCFRNLTRYT